jgi:hypothetical protein
LLTLAVGIGANTAIFTVLDAVVLQMSIIFIDPCALTKDASRGRRENLPRRGAGCRPGSPNQGYRTGTTKPHGIRRGVFPEQEPLRSLAPFVAMVEPSDARQRNDLRSR